MNSKSAEYILASIRDELLTRTSGDVAQAYGRAMAINKALQDMECWRQTLESFLDTGQDEQDLHKLIKDLIVGP